MVALEELQVGESYEKTILVGHYESEFYGRIERRKSKQSIEKAAMSNISFLRNLSGNVSEEVQ